MPSGKRSKEDTWTEKDLMKEIQGDSKDKKHRSSREKSSREKDKDRHSEDREKRRESQSHKEKDNKTDHDKHRRSKTQELDGGKHDTEKKHRKHKTEEGRVAHVKNDDENKHRKHTEDKEDRNDRDSERKKHREDREHRKHSDRKHRDKADKEAVEKHADDEKEHRSHKDKRRRHRGEDTEENYDQREYKEKHKNREDRHKDRKEHDSNERRKHRDKEERSKEKEKRAKHKEQEGSGSKKYKEEDGTHKSSKESDDQTEKEKRRKEKEKEKAKRRKEREEEMLKALEDTKEENKITEEDTNYDYDDDFDDYDDDDFEEEEEEEEDNDQEESDTDNDIQDSNDRSDNKQKVQSQESKIHLSKSEQHGVSEVLKAISAENKIAASQAHSRSASRPSTGSDKEDTKEKESAKKTFGKINFIAASQKQLNEKTAKKTKKRGQELLQLIQLDVRSIELFDMPPMTEYELYMKRFGQSDSKQTFTQTNDDDVTQETQTDEVETESKWCQFTHDIKACGSDDGDKMDTSYSSNLTSTSSVRLNKFLLKASQVCNALLEELAAGIEQPQRQYTESRGAFSDGYVTLESSNFLVLGRNFCDLAYSMSQTNMLLTAYGASNVVTKHHKSPKGLICLWNTNEPTKPLKLLTCESIPMSCCFSSGKASMAFAGMEDGIIAAWDLTEPASYHDNVMIGNTSHVFRTATFTTAASSENHMFSVVTLAPITSNASYHAESDSNDDVDMSFQLASLDQSGVINIWIVVAVEPNSTNLSSVDDDLGLSPRGRIKLVKSATITPASSSIGSFANLFSFTCLQIDPTKLNHLYCGTDQGEVLHLVRFGNRPTPKSLKPSEDGNNQVYSIDISPWRMPYLLACYSDGSVHLFNLNKETPVACWSMFSNGSAVLDVKWSRSKPNVFFAIDSQSVLYSWDLLASDSGPILEQKLRRKDKRAIGFAFANDYTSLGVGTPGRAAEMAVVYGDGSVEIHRLSNKLCRMSGDELDRTQQYFDEFTN